MKADTLLTLPNEKNDIQLSRGGDREQNNFSLQMALYRHHLDEFI